MKINGVGTGARVEIGKNEKTNKNSRFQTLLESNIDKIDSHEESDSGQSGEQQQPNREAAKLIEDAACMLDRAMDQIQATGQPNPEVVESLQRLSHSLNQTNKRATPDKNRIADVLVAVETQRLQNW